MKSQTVPGWDRYSGWRQYMVLDVATPLADALQGLAVGLKASRFRIRRRTAQGFRATNFTWLGLIIVAVDWTTLDVRADPLGGPHGSRIVVSVVAGGEHRWGCRRAAAGLSAAVDDLRRRGITAETTPWMLVE